MVSAWAGEEEIVLGQAAVDEKNNEITAIPKLPDIKGSAVTIDAMGCQTEIAARIRKKQAGYILAAKDNQPTLHEDIREYFAGLENGDIRDLPDDIGETELEKGRGRIEKREVRLVSTIRRLAGKEKWKDLKTIIQYRTHRTVNGTTVQTVRYYISNSQMNADEMYRYLRGHRSIENRLHWSLDVVFREDAAKVRKDHAPENLNILMKIALSLLRAASLPEKHITRMTVPKRRFAPSLCPDYLFSIFFGK